MSASKQGGGRPAAAGDRPAALDLATPALDPGEGVADPAMAEGGQPPMVTVPSPHGDSATGKGEEEAVGDEKEKMGLAGGGSPAMEATAAPAAGERRGKGGEPSALIPYRKW
ncbi:hypothetical protein GUJ93_ZPchr0015g6789 [Zizania palustris]|uniref:Uncharacterized protein n=1 Tax=Zizania palustris TaxID=103762 RepID=A0A8J5SYX7_ZIZPA|nr:hypothetical protein GUJ93_ZPchr0015g6789 [Zizania palustris]